MTGRRGRRQGRRGRGRRRHRQAPRRREGRAGGARRRGRSRRRRCRRARAAAPLRRHARGAPEALGSREEAHRRRRVRRGDQEALPEEEQKKRSWQRCCGSGRADVAGRRVAAVGPRDATCFHGHRSAQRCVLCPSPFKMHAPDLIRGGGWEGDRCNRSKCRATRIAPIPSPTLPLKWRGLSGSVLVALYPLLARRPKASGWRRACSTKPHPDSPLRALPSKGRVRTVWNAREFARRDPQRV